MNTQITIIGLGQIGASIGMALKDNKNIKRVGCDKDAAVAKAAQSLEVVDEIKNLPAAVKDAAIVVLCLPLSEIRETFRHIGPWLADNAVVMDTAPIKSGVIQWAQGIHSDRPLLYRAGAGHPFRLHCFPRVWSERRDARSFQKGNLCGGCPAQHAGRNSESCHGLLSFARRKTDVDRHARIGWLDDLGACASTIGRGGIAQCHDWSTRMAGSA